MKDLIFVVGIVAVFLLSLNSCDKTEGLDLDRLDGGIIESTFDFGDCYSTIGLSEKHWIIKDQKAYKELDVLALAKASCANISLPNINFSSNYLMGILTDNTCDQIITQKVVKNDLEKTITYQITMDSKDACGALKLSKNWVLVETFPEDYQVAFEVRRLNP